MNVANLVNQWSTVTFNPTSTAVSTSATNITHGSPVPFTATVSPNSGTGSPTGKVSLLGAPQPPNSGLTSLGMWDLSGGSISASTNAVPGGTYQLMAYYAGDSTFAPSSGFSAYFTVTAEPSATTVSVLSANQKGQSIPFTSGPFGSFVYVRADVAGQSGYGVPSGTVTFNDSFGAIPGGSVFTLNGQGNTANPNGVFNFDAGTHTVSASYSGDPSFNPSSATQPQTFTITPGFYVAMAGQPAVIIKTPGGAGSTSLNISNSTGFSGTITLACAGLPSEATCAFSPASVKTTGTVSTTTAVVTVTTTAATTATKLERRSYFLAQWMMGMGMLLSLFFVTGKRYATRGACLLLLLAVTMGIVSCGGGGGSSSTPPPPPPNPGTPTGTYNVVVTATSGSNLSKTGFTLVVQ